MSEVTKIKSIQAVAVTDELVGEDMVANDGAPVYKALTSNSVAEEWLPPVGAIGCIIRCNDNDASSLGGLKYRLGATDATQAALGGSYISPGQSTSFIPYAGRITMIRSSTTSAEGAVEWQLE